MSSCQQCSVKQLVIGQEIERFALIYFKNTIYYYFNKYAIHNKAPVINCQYYTAIQYFLCNISTGKSVKSGLNMKL